jgi:hypothetical protein
MKRLLACIVSGVLLVGLVGCGPPKKSVFPPTVTIQELHAKPGGSWQVVLRIQNNSYGEMDFKMLQGELKIAELMPVLLNRHVDLDIPAFAADVTQVEVLPTAQMASALQAIADKGSAGSLAYTISGSITAKPEQEEQQRSFEFHGKNWLSPVPGIPDTYR